MILQEYLPEVRGVLDFGVSVNLALGDAVR